MPKKAHSSAKVLLRAQEKVMVARRSNSEYAGLFVSDAADDKGRGKLQSVVERNDLDDFLCNALLSEQSFESERGQVIVMNLDQAVQAEEVPYDEEILDYQDLPIPRRPLWDEDTTPEVLDRQERDAFLAWRRDLARVESASKLSITPYEKNLEVWKQLYVH